MGDTNNTMASASNDEVSGKPPPGMMWSGNFRTPYIYERTDSGDDDDEIFLRRRVTSQQSSSGSFSGPNNGIIFNSQFSKLVFRLLIMSQPYDPLLRRCR